MKTDYDIVGSFGAERIVNINSETNINLFEFIDSRGKKPRMLLPTSGLEQKIDFSISDGGFRAMFVYKNVLYAVVKDQVFEIDTALVFSPIGTLNTETGYVGVDANNAGQIIFVDGTEGWIFDTNASTFTQITAGGFPAQPIDACFLDGYFIVADGETPKFYLSALNDGMTWDPLDFALITTHPGTIVGLRTLHRRLFIFSQNYTEVWENVGLGDFPLRRNNSLLMEFGAASVGSIISDFDMLFFLSQTKSGLGSIMKVTGTQAIPVSNQALDYQIQKYDVISDARAMLYKDNGIIFFRLNFTNENVTWVYNVIQSQPNYPMWHEEQMLDESRHVGEVSAYFNGLNYFGHYAKGILYQVDDSFLTNAGEAIKRVRIGKQFIDEAYRKIRIDRLIIDFIQGNATENGNDAQPTAILYISNDYGQTFGNGDRQRLGRIGDRKVRTVWRDLGAADSFCPKIEFYNKIKFAILGASASYEVLPE